MRRREGSGLIAAWTRGDDETLRRIAAEPGERGASAKTLLAAQHTLDTGLTATPQRSALRLLAELVERPQTPELGAISLAYASHLVIGDAHIDDGAAYCRRLGLQQGLEGDLRALPVIAQMHLALRRAYFNVEPIDDGAMSAAVARGSRLGLEAGARPWLWFARTCLDYANWREDAALAERWIGALRALEPRLSSERPLDWMGVAIAISCALVWLGHHAEALDEIAAIRRCLGQRRLPEPPRLRRIRVDALIGLHRLDEAEAEVSAQRGGAATMPAAQTPAHELELSARLALARKDLARARELVRADFIAPESRERARVTVWRERLDLELIDRRPLAARQTLQYIEREGGSAWLGGYWARLLALEGAFAAAAARIETFASGRPRRMLHAFRFAYEMSASELSLLLSLAGSQPARPAERPAPPAPAPHGVAALVGDSPGIVAARELIARFAQLDAGVLVQGETGTGKEIAARALHDAGPRRDEPFVAVNCASLSDTLIESELFGHVAGAFTGAAQDYEGLFLAAGRGTVFLDEITSMSERMQAGLLRVLESGEVRPVGSAKPRQMRARIVAAANRRLVDAATGGGFRSDLYYRLARLVVDLPPLRERGDDIEILARLFLARLRADPPYRIGPRLSHALRRHSWPGNVRELKNQVERLALLAGDAEELDDADLPLPVAAPARLTAPAAPIAHHPEDRIDVLDAALRSAGRMTCAQAMRILGCAPKTASKALLELERRGLARRVLTSAHLRTSYFEPVPRR